MILYGDIVVKIRNKEDHYIVTWSDLQDKLLREMQDIEQFIVCYILCKKVEDKVKKRIKGDRSQHL